MKKIHYKVYQMKIDFPDIEKVIFRNSETVKKYNCLKKENYNLIYESNLIIEHDDKNISYILEDIWKRFNLHIPSDFKGHALSVGDIIMIKSDYYFCESIGFSKIDFK